MIGASFLIFKKTIRAARGSCGISKEHHRPYWLLGAAPLPRGSFPRAAAAAAAAVAAALSHRTAFPSFAPTQTAENSQPSAPAADHPPHPRAPRAAASNCCLCCRRRRCCCFDPTASPCCFAARLMRMPLRSRPVANYRSTAQLSRASGPPELDLALLALRVGSELLLELLCEALHDAARHQPLQPLRSN